MTTTQVYQIKPNFYPTKEDCIESLKKTVNTNPRYKHFNQTHFTAGDEEQFNQYRDTTNGTVKLPTISLKHNYFQDYPINIWEKYEKINGNTITDTFHYLFHKFKKGIFVKIKNNKLAVFLPFSKKNFTNEWHQHIKVNPRYNNMNGFIRYIYSLENRPFNPKYVNKFTNTWYTNNSLIRFEYPICEGDTNHAQISDMLQELCKQRKLPDIEFFINRRDYPLLKRNGTEPYDDIYGKDTPLVSHSYDKYAPVLSMVTSDEFADIPIPTGDDWARISMKEGKYFPKTCREYLTDFTSIKWSSKKPIAVFRGSSTGSGTTIETNQRLKLVHLAQDSPLIDAGITSWNLRPRKLSNKKYLTTIHIDKLPFGLSKPLSPQEQSNYKFIINVDGHVSAFRLSLELGMGSCILLVDSPYKLWYHNILKPYVHYVPIKNDLSDLLDQVKWCKNNDSKCKQISINAKKIYDTYLSKKGILDYFQKLLLDLKVKTGEYIYNSISPLELQLNKQRRFKPYFPFYKQLPNKITIQSYKREYGTLKGIEWIINCINSKRKLFDYVEKGDIIFKSQSTVNTKYQLGNIPLKIKKIINTEKQKEGIHETFIGVKCINELCKYIPNFSYTFGSFQHNVITEYIEGETLSEYINSSSFSMTDYISILLQLSLALYIAQRDHCFVHNDLTPWNIIIQKHKEVKEYDYIIDHKTVYHIKTNITPVIIDFGKSHVVYNKMHYGFINMYKTSTIQDVLSLITTSIYDVTNNPKNNKYIKDIITISNFISGTQYRNKNFFETGRNGLGEIRYFFNKTKKYEYLISSQKYELENKTPLAFVKYLLRAFSHMLPITCDNQYTDRLNTCNALQVYSSIFAETPEEYIKTYTDLLEQISTMPLKGDPLVKNYLTCVLKHTVETIYQNLLSYLDKNSLPNTYCKLYKKALKHVNTIEQVDNCKVATKYKEVNEDTIEYNNTTFLEPDKILKILRKYNKGEPKDITEEIKIIRESIVMYSINKYGYEYENKYKKLLTVNEVKVRNSVANYHTLRKISEKIYREDEKLIPNDRNIKEILEIVIKR